MIRVYSSEALNSVDFSLKVAFHYSHPKLLQQAIMEPNGEPHKLSIHGEYFLLLSLSLASHFWIYWARSKMYWSQQKTSVDFSGLWIRPSNDH